MKTKSEKHAVLLREEATRMNNTELAYYRHEWVATARRISDSGKLNVPDVWCPANVAADFGQVLAWALWRQEYDLRAESIARSACGALAVVLAEIRPEFERQRDEVRS